MPRSPGALTGAMNSADGRQRRKAASGPGCSWAEGSGSRIIERSTGDALEALSGTMDCYGAGTYRGQLNRARPGQHLEGHSYDDAPAQAVDEPSECAYSEAGFPRGPFRISGNRLRETRGTGCAWHRRYGALNRMRTLLVFECLPEWAAGA
jgi:hypothetical protein